MKEDEELEIIAEWKIKELKVETMVGLWKRNTGNWCEWKEKKKKQEKESKRRIKQDKEIRMEGGDLEEQKQGCSEKGKTKKISQYY